MAPKDPLVTSTGKVNFYGKLLQVLTSLAVEKRPHNKVGETTKAVKTLISETMNHYAFIGMSRGSTYEDHYKELLTKAKDQASIYDQKAKELLGGSEK
jgi:hypothetical protein